MKSLLTIGLLLFTIHLALAQQRRANPALDSLKKEKDPGVLKQKLQMLENGSEKELQLLIQFYNDTPGKADSLVQLAIKRFPKGDFAFNQAQNTLFTAQGGAKQEDLFQKMKAKFPANNFDYAFYSVAYAYANDKNIAKVSEYVTQIKDVGFRAAAARLTAEAVMKYDLPAAEQITRKEIEALMKGGVPPEPVAGSTPSPANEARSSYFAFLDLYSTILLKSGKYQEALKYSKEAYLGSSRKTDQLTGNYSLALSKNGLHQEALPLLEKQITEGKAGQDLKLAFKESYAKLNPDKNAVAYLALLEQGMKSKVEAEVAKMLINEAAPNFTVKDVNGKTVSLNDFKGKTIVLDFWATWCGPCKKSFPAMQLAVNKYKNDPSVKFLFIHTWENVAQPLTDAQSYLNSNNYKFDLYMDTKDPKTKVNPAVSAFGVKGIPAKFVIDAKGRTRFKMTGFSGGDDAAVAELTAMIGLAKKS